MLTETLQSMPRCEELARRVYRDDMQLRIVVLPGARPTLLPDGECTEIRRGYWAEVVREPEGGAAEPRGRDVLLFAFGETLTSALRRLENQLCAQAQSAGATAA